MMRLIITTFLLSLLFLYYATPSQAAKPRVRKTASVPPVSFSSAKILRASHSVRLNLFNLDKVSKIQYTLSYTANGVPQGVVGSLIPSGSGDTRDFYFGTCSHGACTAHSNITNASLTVTTTLKSGGTYSKRYRVKV